MGNSLRGHSVSPWKRYLNRCPAKGCCGDRIPSCRTHDPASNVNGGTCLLDGVPPRVAFVRNPLVLGFRQLESRKLIRNPVECSADVTSRTLWDTVRPTR